MKNKNIKLAVVGKYRKDFDLYIERVFDMDWVKTPLNYKRLKEVVKGDVTYIFIRIPEDAFGYVFDKSHYLNSYYNKAATEVELRIKRW